MPGLCVSRQCGSLNHPPLPFWLAPNTGKPLLRFVEMVQPAWHAPYNQCLQFIPSTNPTNHHLQELTKDNPRVAHELHYSRLCHGTGCLPDAQDRAGHEPDTWHASATCCPGTPKSLHALAQQTEPAQARGTFYRSQAHLLAQ